MEIVNLFGKTIHIAADSDDPNNYMGRVDLPYYGAPIPSVRYVYEKSSIPFQSKHIEVEIKKTLIDRLPMPKIGTIFIVSWEVAQASDRLDIYYPDLSLESGAIINDFNGSVSVSRLLQRTPV